LGALYVAYQDSIKEFFLFYIWDYFDARFFSNPKQLLYTEERKWVVLQRPNHMGSYYE
jgi:hypothetical protein